MSLCNDTIGNRNRDLLVCSTVPPPTAPPRVLYYVTLLVQFHIRIVK